MGDFLPSIQVSSVIEGRKSDVFNFLFREEAWDRGLPTTFDAVLLEGGPLRAKTVLKWRLSRFGVSFDWAIKIDEVKSNEQVVVSQVLGLFDTWILTQALADHGENATKIIDTIEYKLPLGLIGCVLDDLWVRRELKSLLENRHEKILQLFQNHRPKRT